VFSVQRRRWSCVTLALLLCAPLRTSAQTVWHVDDDCVPPGTGTTFDPFCNIQDAVDAAEHGDTVLASPGTYSGDGNRDISLFGKMITLKSSAGATETILDIQGGPGSIHRALFLIHGETLDTVIEGFTVKNAYLIGDTGGTGPGGGGGGAIYIRESSPTIRSCIIVENVSATLHPPFPVDGRGAGIYVDGNSSAIIEDCIIADNVADRRGKGMYIGYENSRVTVRNCLISGNSAGEVDGYSGGGVYNTFANTVIVNTAVLYNESGAGGGVHNEHGELFLRNCIVWGNQAVVGPQIVVQGAFVSVEYSDVEGGLGDVFGFSNPVIEWGPGNIDADPLFVDPEGGDFRLLPGSPCIDAGNNFAVPGDLLVDMDEFARFADHIDTPDTGNGDGVLGVVDMGPYEFGGEDCNNNGTPDIEDVAKGDSDDCDANNIPDECEPDCNQNGQADLCDLTEELSDDCDANIRPDECQIDADSPAPGGPFYCIVDTNSCDPDCNANGVIDECDIAAETSIDCNANVVPDECEPDCNANGQADECDLADGTSDDCNFNVVPDECEITIPIPLQPQDQNVELGETASFLILVQAFQPTFQWRKNGVDLQDDDRIDGSDSGHLTISEVIPEDAGEYDCVIIDLLTGCTNTTDSATLTVHGPCPADFDDNGAVGPFDLAILLGNWGPNPNHPADLNDDDIIDASDLALLLGSWGLCPPP